MRKTDVADTKTTIQECRGGDVGRHRRNRKVWSEITCRQTVIQDFIIFFFLGSPTKPTAKTEGGKEMDTEKKKC